MENIKNIRERIEKNIETLNIEAELKENLLDINRKLYNIAINEKAIPFKLILDNLEQELINLFLDYITDMIDSYDIADEPKTFNDEYKNLDRIKDDDLIVIDDFKVLEPEIEHHHYRFSEFLTDINKCNCSIIITCEDKIEKHYTQYFDQKSISNKLEIHVEGKDYTTEEIINNLKKLYKENGIKYCIKDTDLIPIIHKLLEEDDCYRSNTSRYLYDYSYKQKTVLGIEKITLECFPKTPKDSDKEIKLADLVGLHNVKKEITALKNYLAFRKNLKSTVEAVYLNLMFLGNPGTGKTTVSKIYTKILYELGYIKENKVVEIVPNDLMGKYVGHTKDQTRKFLDRARGGVLFIDEAYTIADVTFKSGQASFMKEAVVELLKYMENPENVVIFAGYPIETRKIYDSNPGFKSRICKEIYFDDYTEEELMQILKKKLLKLGLRTNKETDAEIKEVLRQEKAKKNFGNARFCNTYLQTILINHANQCLEEENFLITKNDCNLDERKKFQIGFVGGK